MSHRAMEWAWSSPFKLGIRLVLLCLTNHAGDHGVTWISIDTMVSDCNLSKAAVYEAIAELIKAGWVVKSKAKLSKLVEDGLISDDKVHKPHQEVCLWRVKPHFPDSGKPESVQKSVNVVPESGQNFPDSGKIRPDSGKPPHPHIGSNRNVTVMEPSAGATGQRPLAGGDGEGFSRTTEKPGETRFEQDKRERRETVRRVFAYYCERTGRSERMYSLTDQRMEKGLHRLQDCWKKTNGDLSKAEELMRIAVDAIASSPFHNGENDKNRRYTDWSDHLFKSTDKLERWLEAE